MNAETDPTEQAATDAQQTDPVPSPAEKGKQPQTLGQLSQKIARRTTDLIAIGIIGVAFVGIGGKVSHWWKRDPADIPSSRELADSVAGSEFVWGADGSPVQLEFGSYPFQIERRHLQTTLEKATAELSHSCEQLLTSGAKPSSIRHPSEIKLLQKLVDLKPIKEQPDQWQLYHIPGPGHFIVGTTINNRGPFKNGLEQRRLVCWGMVFPSPLGGWTLFTFSSLSKTSTSTPDGDWPSLSLPSGAQKILSVRSPDGGMMMAFRGRTDPRDWQRFLTVSLVEQGWELTNPWTELDNSFQGRFQKSADRSPGWIDIHLVSKSGNIWQGLISSTPVKPLTDTPQH